MIPQLLATSPNPDYICLCNIRPRTHTFGPGWPGPREAYDMVGQMKRMRKQALMR